MGSSGRADREAAGRERAPWTSRRPARASLSILAAAAALGGPAVGIAAPGGAAAEPAQVEIAAARQLFHQGKELEKRGAWVEALEKFRKVAAVKVTPQVRFHLALCQENLGQLVEAMNGFELATQEASQLGARAAEVLDNAPKRLDALRQRIARLRIEVTGGTARSRVLLDGRALAPALVGTDIPVDPGAHTVELRVGDTVVLTRSVTLAERDIHVMELDADHAARPTTPGPQATTVPASSGAGGAASFGAHTPSLVAGGTGLLALVGAGVFFGLRESALGVVRATCDPGTLNNCSPDTRPDFERSQTYTTVATVLTGVGVAGLGTAAVLWFVLPPTVVPGATRVLVAPQAGGVRITVAY